MELGTLSKKEDYAFNKNVYLLGIGKDKKSYWLVEPRWDCGWYWGFGYIQSYTHNTPHKARDIDMHTHFDSVFLNNGKYVDGFMEVFESTTLNKEELWTLCELMKSFYIMRESAEVFGRGGAHISANPCKDAIQDADMVKKINEDIIPSITNKIIELLKP